MTWTAVLEPLFTTYVTVSASIRSAPSHRKLTKGTNSWGFTGRNKTHSSFFLKQKWTPCKKFGPYGIRGRVGGVGWRLRFQEVLKINTKELTHQKKDHTCHY